jgi:hypothetical protein
MVCPDGQVGLVDAGLNMRLLARWRTVEFSRSTPAHPGANPSVRSWLLFENCIVDASIFLVCVSVEGARWMPWYQEPMKDVGGCDKPGGVVNRAVIPGCPNGVTRLELCPVTAA